MLTKYVIQFKNSKKAAAQLKTHFIYNMELN